MKRYRAVMGCFVAVVLCGCESEAEYRAKWMRDCVAGEFSEKQCSVLYSVHKSAKDDAAAAQAAAGFATGFSAATAGMRR